MKVNKSSGYLQLVIIFILALALVVALSSRGDTNFSNSTSAANALPYQSPTPCPSAASANPQDFQVLKNQNGNMIAKWQCVDNSFYKSVLFQCIDDPSLPPTDLKNNCSTDQNSLLIASTYSTNDDIKDIGKSFYLSNPSGANILSDPFSPDPAFRYRAVLLRLSTDPNILQPQVNSSANANSKLLITTSTLPNISFSLAGEIPPTKY